MRRLFIVSACLSIFVAAFAQDSPRYVNINGGPYLTNVTSTSFTVVYTTNMDAVSWVEIAPDDDTHFYNQERPAFYDKRGLGRRPITRTHKITVTGLEPGTTYRYRAMAKGVLEQDNRKSIVYTEGFGMDLNSHPCKVTTLGSDYKSVKFSVVNDMHSHDSVLCRLFADAAGKYDFVLFNGDMTSSIDTESQIMDDYLRSASRLFGECTPIHFVRGNHEYRGNAALKFYDYLDSPTGRTWYSFSYGDFFFLILDGGEDKCQSDVRNLDIMRTEDYVAEESEWLAKTVVSSEYENSKVRIAFCHMPPSPKGWYGNAMVSKYLVPALNEAGLDLMLCGHIHKFKNYDKQQTGTSFPVICNANQQRMDVDVSEKEIRLDFYNSDGLKLRNLVIPVGKNR